MKIVIIVISLFLSFQMKSQKLPIIVNDIMDFNEYSDAIKNLCNELKGEINNQMKIEILSYSYHNIFSQFNKNRKFKNRFKYSTETITMAILSKEYGIEHTFVSLLNGSDTYIFGLNHEKNNVYLVCKEQNDNTFYKFIETLENSKFQGFILIIKSYPDGEGYIDIKYGLSIGSLQIPFYLDQFAKNIK